jgi:hypothetical protein
MTLDAGASKTTNADVGGQAVVPAVLWSRIFIVPVSRSGRSELTGLWRIDHSIW